MASSCQTTGFDFAAGSLVRAVRGAGLAVLMAGLAACSSAPDWAKPSLIYGEDASEAAAAAPQTEKDFPELADVPDAPRPYSSEAERAAIADGLANDRARARYTDEVLRGGTEPPAPAPVTSRPTPVTAPASAGPSSDAGASSAPQAAFIPSPSRNSRPLPNAQVAPNAQAADVPAARGAESEAVSTAPLPAPVVEKVEALPATSSTRTPAAAPVAAAPTAAPAPVAAARAPVSAPAAAAPEITRRAAVPAVPGGSSRSTSGSSQAYTTQTRPSGPATSGAESRSTNVASTRAVAPPGSEPALTATRSSLAPAVTHSRDTFEASRAPAIANEALEAAGSVVSSRYGKQAPSGSADPEDPVEVNLDALRGAPGPGASMQAPTLRRIATAGEGLAHDGGSRLVASVESSGGQGGPGNIPPYVVSFANGSTSLNVTDRHLIAEAADIALNTGRVVRVVGHASGIASNEDARARLANFGVSMDRATAVANELIRQGVPGGQVIVEAKGASEPAFYETAPNGDAGNRRAEIFIE
ncbi:MAG: OmpA family protein [Parvibaculum sp.]